MGIGLSISSFKMRQAVKRFFIKTLALGIPFALFLGAYEFRASRVHPNSFSVKKALMERQARDVEVLVLGSSHAYYDVLPGLLGRPAFNLADVSQSFFYDRALLKKYLGQMPSLKLVVLPVSYFSLGYQLDDGTERWRSYYYYKFYGLHHRDWRQNWNVRNFSDYFLCNDQLGGIRKVLRGKIKDVSADYDPLGGWTNRVINHAWEKPLSLPESAPVALKRHHDLMKSQHVQENAVILEDIIHELKVRGIKLVLVTTPVTHYYSDGMNAGQYQQMQDILKRLSLDYGVRYFNYSFDSRFLDEDFYDCDHLNLHGAQKFSLLLKADVILPSTGS
jgi:hypothetical protein